MGYVLGLVSLLFLVISIHDSNYLIAIISGIVLISIISVKFSTETKEHEVNTAKNNRQKQNNYGGTNQRTRRETAISASHKKNHSRIENDIDYDDYVTTSTANKSHPYDGGEYETYSPNDEYERYAEEKLKEKEEERRKAEEEAYFYRKHDGPEWKVKAADDVLERTTQEREYENDKHDYHPVCNECNHYESDCRCCDECGKYRCQCCRECGEANCICCRNCHTHPCECCDECGEARCRCCNRCDSYPCDCCDECGNPNDNCRCCNRCDSYPCECCDSCGQPDRYCRCE